MPKGSGLGFRASGDQVLTEHETTRTVLEGPTWKRSLTHPCAKGLFTQT